MKVQFTLWTVFMILLTSCAVQKNTSSILESSPVLNVIDSVSVNVKCKNLSEEMTNSDELAILIYSANSSAPLDSAILKRKFNITRDSMNYQTEWVVPHKLLTQDILIFLIEIDEGSSLEQFDAILRIHAHSIIKAREQRNAEALEKFLGKEDLLGYLKLDNINLDTPVKFFITGSKLFDRYEYEIMMEKK